MHVAWRQGLGPQLDKLAEYLEDVRVKFLHMQEHLDIAVYDIHGLNAKQKLADVLNVYQTVTVYVSERASYNHCSVGEKVRNAVH